jgi:hypothetical protein
MSFPILYVGGILKHVLRFWNCNQSAAMPFERQWICAVVDKVACVVAFNTEENKNIFLY